MLNGTRAKGSYTAEPTPYDMFTLLGLVKLWVDRVRVCQDVHVCDGHMCKIEVGTCAETSTMLRLGFLNPRADQGILEVCPDLS
jgi:hypothetical protein